MSTNFFNLSEEEQLGLIKKTSDQLALSPTAIEKDIWICWVLEKIFALPIQMAFKGGTSLSKVFGLIKRFSEDCDVTIDYRNFKPEFNIEDKSRTQLKKMSGELKLQLKNYILEMLLPYLQKHVSETFPGKIFEITISEDGEQLRFYYPSIMSMSQRYLRDHVFIEFGVRNSTEPCKKHQISTYLSQVVIREINLPQAMVDTLSPLRTFWEKATLIHVECQRDRFESTPERLSRHWYDLFMLNNSWVSKESLTNKGILESVVNHKKAFFNASYANYDDCLSGNFRIIPGRAYLNKLEKDFDKMIDAGMFYERPLKFNQMIDSLDILQTSINEYVNLK